MKAAAICLFLTGLPASAQQGPSFDCAEAATSAEEVVCAVPDLAGLDLRLAERYAAAVAAAGALDAGARNALDVLRATQRGWIKGRDECWKAADLVPCVRDAYLTREAELVGLWMLEEPTSVRFWICNEEASNEVVTTFFDTERPSVRIERGDRVSVGVLSEGHTGERYNADFGEVFWLKRGIATYREPDPDGTEYTCLLSR